MLPHLGTSWATMFVSFSSSIHACGVEPRILPYTLIPPPFNLQLLFLGTTCDQVKHGLGDRFSADTSTQGRTEACLALRVALVQHTSWSLVQHVPGGPITDTATGSFSSLSVTLERYVISPTSHRQHTQPKPQAATDTYLAP